MTNRYSTSGVLRSIKTGHTTVTYIPDGFVQLHPRSWFLDDATSNIDRWLDREGFLVGSIGSLLIESSLHDEIVLIDTGVGPVYAAKEETGGVIGAISGGLLLDNLRAIGIEPTDVTTVIYTHLHEDHTGWTRSRASNGQSVFSNTLHRVHQSELSTAAGSYLNGLRVEPYSDEEVVSQHIRSVSTSGHTQGHCVFEIETGGTPVLILGDSFHSPIQITDYHRRVTVDHDRVLGVSIRKNLLKNIADTPTIIVGGHFADVVFGKVVTVEGKYTWVPIETG